MLKCFPIDFVRQVLEQKLLEEHLLDSNLFGGKNQVNLLSFYEQLKGKEEVDRFVETYRDLVNQQNNSDLILNGVVVSPENPNIANLYSVLIVPLTWSCSFRCTLENRDQALITLNNLIDKLRGRKVDVAQLECVDDNGKKFYQPFVVGTIGQSSGSQPALKDGDFIGVISTPSTQVQEALAAITSKGIFTAPQMAKAHPFYYAQKAGTNTIKVIGKNDGGTYLFLEDTGAYNNIIFPPEHTNFERYKLSMSFDALRCEEPRTLNSQDYCEIVMSGSATLVNSAVRLGNDLIKIKFHKYKIKAETDIDLSSLGSTYLEPLEMPSGSNANTKINQLVSNKFISMSHTNAIGVTLQYTFIYDSTNGLLIDLFKYGRYGIQQTPSLLSQNGITPNLIFEISEIWSSWGAVENITYYGKLIENIDIENTESDTLTIGLTMQVQGDVE